MAGCIVAVLPVVSVLYNRSIQGSMPGCIIVVLPSSEIINLLALKVGLLLWPYYWPEVNASHP